MKFLNIGYDVSDESGKKLDLYGGAESATKVWEDYIKAHNEGDLEAITKLILMILKFGVLTVNLSMDQRLTLIFYQCGLKEALQSGSQIILFQIN